MTERNIDTAMWGDTWFQELAPPQKLLFIYLWTNPRCSSAGLYEVSLRSIAFDTGLPFEVVPELLEGLSPKIAWYPEYSLIWVKNFLRRQTRSPQFLVSVARALHHIPPELVSEFLQYNHTLPIPYDDPLHTLPIPPQYPMPEVSPSLSLRPALDQPKTRPDKEDTLSLKDTSAAASKKVSFSEYTEDLRKEFSGLPFDDELRKFNLYWFEGSRKLKNPKLALLNWMTKARKQQEASTYERSNGNRQYSPAPPGIPGNRPAGAFADLD